MDNNTNTETPVIPVTQLVPRYRALLSDPSLGLVSEIRPSQIQMAAGVQDIIEHGGLYAVEAPVGSGKTYAYLLPALLAGKRVLVVTPKKGLQDQIIKKDLPALQTALGQTIPVVMLKGKGNYTCQLAVTKRGYWAELVPHAQGKKVSGEPRGAYFDFLKESKYGDRADWSGQVPIWWGKANAENCIGNSCPHAKSCGYMKLRQELSLAQVVVGNHHLLGFDLTWGLGKVVGGGYEVLIVDEAHKLVDGLRAAFTQTITDSSADDFTHRIRDEVDIFNINGIHTLTSQWATMFDSLNDTPSCTPNCQRYGSRGCYHWKQAHERATPVFNEQAVINVLETVGTLIKEITSFIKKTRLDETGKPVDLHPDMQYPMMILERSAQQLEEWKSMLAITQGKVSAPPANKDEEGEETAPLSESELAERAERILKNTLIHCQVSVHGKIQVQAVPIVLAPITGGRLAEIKSIVLTSATLAVDGAFDNIKDSLGVAPTKTDILLPVFNYEKQSVLYVPKDLVPVSRPPKYKEDDITVTKPYKDYIAKLIDRCVTLINQAKGGVFVLTTANDEMKLLDEGIRARCRFPTFTQGRDGDPQAVLAAFMKNKNAILIGSKSFWEGVDVQGGALRLVIIPKLPFPSAKDPLIEARRKAAGNGSAKDGWPFVDYPDMLMDLRQGTGRLIRSTKDKGMVAVLDGRLWTKGYGQRILKALPFKQLTSKAENATWYLEQLAKAYG